MKTLKKLYARFVSKTPAIFAWTRNLGIALSSVTSTVFAFPDQYPESFPTYAKYVAGFCLLIAFLSQFATITPLPKPDDADSK